MRLLLLIFFFVSGACGLIYEVVWTKLFAFAMGGTTYAISTVLAAFMGGLALGSWRGGKWIDRRGNPFLFYGIIEGAIGIYCLFIPLLVKLIPLTLGPFYDRYYTDNPLVFGFLRFVLSAAILIIPTGLMGASLPVLCRYYATQKSRFGWEVGRLFTVNTFGACVGSFSAGFFLLPTLGKRLTIHFAAAANIGICITVLVFWFLRERKRAEKTAGKSAEETGISKSDNLVSAPQWGRAVLWAALLLYAANGFAGMAYQVAWTRALTLSIGSSTYSFSIIVTVFILGLGLGSGVGARLVDRLSNPAAAMGLVETAIGFLALWAMWGLGQTPKWMVTIIERYFGSWRNIIGVEFLIVSLLLLLPTIFMGAVFPLAVKTISLCRQGVGETVGVAYGWNTAGAIIGSLAAGFALIPLIGMQNTITVANAVNWMAGAVMLWVIGTSSGIFSRLAKSGLPIAVGIMMTMAMPRWDAGIMNSGPAIYARMSTARQSLFINPESILFYKEGVDITVMVFQIGSESVFLRLNGKTDASSTTDMITQELSGHIPMLAHSNPKRVCIIGLASGVTLGSVLRYPVESAEVVEFSSDVVEAANLFDKWNHSALNDPRVKIIVGDGRNHLTMTHKKYDVIISEPSNPWIAGEATLFTEEYYKLARERLNPGGVFCCWFQGYDISPLEFEMIMRTFQSVFSEATLWETLNTKDYMLVGSLAPIKFDPSILESKIKQPRVFEDIKRVYVTKAAEFFSKFMMGPDSFRAAAGQGELHEDDKLQLEYYAPRHLYFRNNFYPQIYQKIVKQEDKPKAVIGTDEKNWPQDFADGLFKETWAHEMIQAAEYYRNSGESIMAFDYIEKAVLLSPNNGWYKEFIVMVAEQLWNYFMNRGMVEQAIKIQKRAVELYPTNADLRDYLGDALLAMGKTEEARTEFNKALELDPKDFWAFYKLGNIALDERNTQSAAQFYHRSIDAAPYFAPPVIGLGKIAIAQNNYKEAETDFRNAVKLDPQNAEGFAELGKLLLSPQGGNREKEGKNLIRKALKLDPSLRNDPELMRLIGQ